METRPTRSPVFRFTLGVGDAPLDAARACRRFGAGEERVRAGREAGVVEARVAEHARERVFERGAFGAAERRPPLDERGRVHERDPRAVDERFERARERHAHRDERDVRRLVRPRALGVGRPRAPEGEE